MKSLLVALAMLGADVTGTWTGQAPARNGEMQDVTFQFQQSGGALTGKMYGDTEDLPIAEGTISGGRIAFSVKISGGGRGKLLYSGAVEGNEMHLTREREDGEKNAEKKENAKQNFILKRMI